MNQEKTKKPFYKRRWFLGIIVVLILSAIFGGGDKEQISDKNTNNKPDRDSEISENEKIDNEQKIA